MNDEKTKVECRLVARGTEEANSKVIDDLSIPDPESATGAQVIKEVMEKDTKNDNQQETS